MVMTKDDIKAAIKQLSYSQGSYGRLLREIENNPEILDKLEQQNFNTTIDMIFYLEC